MQAKKSIPYAEASFTYLDLNTHIAPPYTVGNIKQAICNLEQVHTSCATLYLTAQETNHPPAANTRVNIYSDTGRHPDERPDDPLLFIVEMTGPDDNTSQPLPARGAFGKCLRTARIGRGIRCIFTSPCDAVGSWCDLCMEDCEKQYDRHP
jgi:hypothetical protein